MKLCLNFCPTQRPLWDMSGVAEQCQFSDLLPCPCWSVSPMGHSGLPRISHTFLENPFLYSSAPPFLLSLPSRAREELLPDYCRVGVEYSAGGKGRGILPYCRAGMKASALAPCTVSAPCGEVKGLPQGTASRTLSTVCNCSAYWGQEMQSKLLQSRLVR